MGKASSAKKVSRAARTGGGRTKRGSSSFLFPSAMALVVVLGTLLIITSRNDRAPDRTLPRPAENGRPVDHWHGAVGFDLCGTFAPPIQSDADPLGIHTHGDGVIHTHPFLPRSAGKNAKLSVYLSTVGAKVSNTSVQVPGQKTMKNGAECDGRPGKIQVKVWPTRDPNNKGAIWKGSPGDIKLLNNQLITVAFVPDGTDIPKPPSEGALDRLTDLGTDTTVPAAENPTASTTPGTPTTVVGDPAAGVDPTVTTTAATPTTTAGSPPTTAP